MTELDVDDTSHRVGAVSRGCTVFQNFDALDRRFRNRAKIEEGLRTAITDRVRSETTAIDQNESRVRSQTAK